MTKEEAGKILFYNKNMISNIPKEMFVDDDFLEYICKEYDDKINLDFISDVVNTFSSKENINCYDGHVPFLIMKYDKNLNITNIYDNNCHISKNKCK